MLKLLLEVDFMQYYEKHTDNKEKRAKRLERKRCHELHLTEQIRKRGYYKPSIFVVYKANKDMWITKRASNSKCQKYLKRATNRRIRKMPNELLPIKGGQYKKAFDYWWEWY